MSASAAAQSTATPFDLVSLAEKLFPDQQTSVEHFFIARRQPLKSVVSVLTRGRKDDSGTRKATPEEILARVNKVDTIWNLSLVHVAVMVGRLDILLKLKEMGATLQSDHLKWFPIHHAIVRANGDETDEIVKALVDWAGGQDKALKQVNRCRGSYLAFKNLLSREKPTVDTDKSKIVGKFCDAAGEITDLTGAEFTRHTGKIFTNEMLASPGDMYSYWQGLCRGTDYLKQEHSKPLDESRKTTEEFALYFVDKTTGYGLTATADIPKDTYLDQAYVGELSGRRPQVLGKIASHSFAYCWSENYASLLPQANLSFPNLKPVTSFKDGCPYTVFVTITDVPNGTPLHWDYSSEFPLARPQPFIELDPLGVIAHVTTTSGWTWIKAIDANKDARNYYLLTHIQPWIVLYCDDKFPFDPADDLEHCIRVLKQLGHVEQPRFLRALQKINSKLKTTRHKDAFKVALKDWNQSYSISTLATGLEFFADYADLGAAFETELAQIKHLLNILSVFSMKPDNFYLMPNRDSATAASEFAQITTLNEAALQLLRRCASKLNKPEFTAMISELKSTS